MTALEMSQLMRQHRFNFRYIQARKQGVKKNDPLGLAEASEVSVTMIGPPRTIHDEKTAGFETAFPHQLLNTRPERSIFKWSKFIE